MDFKTRARRLLVALLVVVPLVNVAPASADGPLQSVVTHNQISIEHGSGFIDPTCPWSSAVRGVPPSAETRGTTTVVYGSANGRETLYLSECVAHINANGGTLYNGGDWTLVRKDGTLTGTVRWGARSSGPGPVTPLRMYLSTLKGTGSLEHAKGKLFFWTCSDTIGGLRLAPKQDYSVCEAP
jgi:hypothetical protein